MKPKKDMGWIENDPQVKKWFASINKNGVGSKHTQRNYLLNVTRYFEWLKTTPMKYIDHAKKDPEKAYRNDLDEYFNYLENKKGLHRNSCVTHYTSIRSFLSFQELTFPRKSFPKSWKKNDKGKLEIDEMKKMLSHIGLRDRTILMVMRDSCLSIQDVLALNYSHVKECLNEEFCHLHILRGKTKIWFDTFLGPESLTLVKEYLEERKSKDETFKNETPLFKTRARKVKRLEPFEFTWILNGVGKNLGISTRSHDFRRYSTSRLKGRNVNETLVEYWSGHTIPKEERAYFKVASEEQMRNYKENYYALSFNGNGDNGRIHELESQIAERTEEFEAVTCQINETDQQIEDMFNALKKKGVI